MLNPVPGVNLLSISHTLRVYCGAMHSILFASNNSVVGPAMAAALACSLRPDAIKAHAAAGQRTRPSKALLAIFNQQHLSWPAEIIDLATVDIRAYDLVIFFADHKRPVYPTLPGAPPLVCWNLDGHAGMNMAEFATLLNNIRDQVATLLNQGYLDALAQARQNVELLMDTLHEGIIAHDLDRRIFFFNRAAEEITGYSRQEILGKDCHTIFPAGFCGDKCSFCDGSGGLKDPSTHYPLTINNRSNEKKRLQMSVLSIKNLLGSPVGVVASFRDMTREIELSARLDKKDQFAGLIGREPRMQELYQTIRDLAASKVSVLIQGESGTGKELVAAAIHNQGPRRDHLFVPVNCGALPENLLESELFGHVRGAFTGAVRDKKGRFELADHGTIFLDEIGDISLAMQVKLLRVLQDGTFQRLGDEKTWKVDVRVISATHKNLKTEISAGRFRHDLFYRICVVPVILPPLRERRDDIPLLARHFLKRFLAEEHRDELIISPETMALLRVHDWPGNIRELQNVIRFLLVRCREDVVQPCHLPPNLRHNENRDTQVVIRRRRQGKLEQSAVRQALRQTGNNRLQAARLLGVSRATLYRFLGKHPMRD